MTLEGESTMASDPPGDPTSIHPTNKPGGINQVQSCSGPLLKATHPIKFTDQTTVQLSLLPPRLSA